MKVWIVMAGGYKEAYSTLSVWSSEEKANAEAVRLRAIADPWRPGYAQHDWTDVDEYDVDPPKDGE